MIVVVLLVLVTWVVLAAVVVGLFHAATGAPTPQRIAPTGLASHLDVEAPAARAA